MLGCPWLTTALVMTADALACDLKKMEARAFHMPEWTATVLRRYHAWKAAGPRPDHTELQKLYAWLFVPPTLWPFNVHHVMHGCLSVLEAGKSLPRQLNALIELLPTAPDEATCAAVAAHEHHVQQGSYENLVSTPAKFTQNEEVIRADPQLLRDWERLKSTFRVERYRDHKGVLRRSMCVERNLRPAFAVNVRRARDVFTAAFDAFCLRWNLYGMCYDEPLLLKVAVNVTPYGTMIHVPAYWSFDPKRDIRWDAVAKLHRLRVASRQGAMLAEGKTERRRLAKRLAQLDQEVRRRGLKGAVRHEFLCRGLGWVPETDAKRITRLRAEFRK